METLRRSLEAVVGERVADVRVLHPDVVADPLSFARALSGRIVRSIGRRGKYLLFSLDDGATLVGHLRMSGRLTLNTPSDPVPPHTHLVLALSSGRELRYQDVRRFGRFLVVPPNGKYPGGLGKLGPEPFDSALTTGRFHAMLKRRPGGLKGVLLDQSFVAGLGNIYVDEALFAAAIHPLERAASLSRERAGRLLDAIRSVLDQGIRNRGTSFDTYIDVNGEPGENEAWLRVFGREGKSCPRCGSGIVKIRVAGRGTHLCPHCQRLSRGRGSTRTASSSNMHRKKRPGPTSTASGRRTGSPVKSS